MLSLSLPFLYSVFSQRPVFPYFICISPQRKVYLYVADDLTSSDHSDEVNAASGAFFTVTAGNLIH